MVVGVEKRSYQVSIPDVILDDTETFATVMNRTDTVCVQRFHDEFNAVIQ